MDQTNIEFNSNEKVQDQEEVNVDVNASVTNMLKDLQEGLRGIMTKKLVEHVELMLNELELSFDYVPKEVYEKIRSRLKKSEVLKDYIKDCCEKLKPFEEQLAKINNVKSKSRDFDYMNDIILFNELNLVLFKDENKNTKKSILNYVYTIYIYAIFLNDDNNFSDKSDNILNELTKLSDVLQSNINKERGNNENGENDKKKGKKKRRDIEDLDNNLGELDINNDNGGKGGLDGMLGGMGGMLGGMGGMLGGMGGLGDMSGMMNEILQNKEIVDIAMQVSQDMQKQQMNPMNILSAFMSGDTSSISGLVSKVENTINKKIEKGEIDQRKLEEQSKKMLETMGSNNGMNLPGLDKILKKM